MLAPGKVLMVLSLVMSMCGCAKQAININTSQTFTLGKESSITSKEITSHFFFSDIDVGLNDPIDAASICHGVENIVRVETQQTWLNALLSGVTYGVYTPRDARVYCSNSI